MNEHAIRPLSAAIPCLDDPTKKRMQNDEFGMVICALAAASGTISSHIKSMAGLLEPQAKHAVLEKFVNMANRFGKDPGRKSESIDDAAERLGREE